MEKLDCVEDLLLKKLGLFLYFSKPAAYYLII